VLHVGFRFVTDHDYVSVVQVSEDSLSYFVLFNKMNQIPVLFSLLGLWNGQRGVSEIVNDGPCHLPQLEPVS